jgi:hypothetical protein
MAIKDPGIPDDYRFAASVNRFDDPSRIMQAPVVDLTSDKPFPNVHGERVFLVKFQIALNVGTHMTMYDRHRSFQTYLSRDSAPAVFADLLAEMQGPRGGYGGIKVCAQYFECLSWMLKVSQMYRYVKRVSDTELSVCLDRQPKELIMW